MEKSNKKAAGLVTQAAYQNTQRNHTKSVAKNIIISLACWGLIPIRFADWVIQRGGLRDA